MSREGRSTEKIGTEEKRDNVEIALELVAPFRIFQLTGAGGSAVVSCVIARFPCAVEPSSIFVVESDWGVD